MRQLKLLLAAIYVLLLGACVTSVVLTSVAALPARARVAQPGNTVPATPAPTDRVHHGG